MRASLIYILGFSVHAHGEDNTPFLGKNSVLEPGQTILDMYMYVFESN